MDKKSKFPKIPNNRFSVSNSAESNRVFLWKNYDNSPFLRPVSGWKIVGFGKAPWPGSSESFAAMLEKITPAEQKNNMFAPDHVRFDEGTRIWQHINKHHFEAFESE